MDSIYLLFVMKNYILEARKADKYISHCNHTLSQVYSQWLRFSFWFSFLFSLEIFVFAEKADVLY